MKDIAPLEQNTAPFALPPAVRACVEGWFGEQGRLWLQCLPAMAAGLCRDWSVVPDGAAMDGGTHALVLPVRRADGTPAVLKIAYPDSENRLEALALAAGRGIGMPRLYRRRARSNAILMEMVVPGRPLASAMHGAQMLESQGGALLRASVALRPDHPFQPAASAARSWLDHMRAHRSLVAGMLPPDACMRAEAFLEAQCVMPPGTMLVNSDGHAGNILSSTRQPWLVVDPKPLAGTAEFEAGCMFAPFAAGPPAGHPELDLSLLYLVGCRARQADPVLAGGWAAAKALHLLVWGLSTADQLAPLWGRGTAALMAAVQPAS
jgi:streptomycin 6-kinase